MSSSNTQTLVVIGSGPGIGVSTASLFASKKFNNVALLSRDSARLATDRQRILDAAKEANRNVDVELWTTDITDSASLQSTLTTVQERMPNITCVLFNAARVAPSELLAHDENEMILDFKITNIGLHTTLKWAVPLLEKLPEESNPSFLVTSSGIAIDPIPQYFALSAVKSAQRSMVLSCQKSFPKIHFGLLNVNGIVSPEEKVLNPTRIAERFWELYEHRGAQEMNIPA